ncbi:hypothetical protein D3C86_1607330 [compost metagenome]
MRLRLLFIQYQIPNLFSLEDSKNILSPVPIENRLISIKCFLNAFCASINAIKLGLFAQTPPSTLFLNCKTSPLESLYILPE